MPEINEFDKDPDAELDYSVDWSEWLADGETISTSTWTVPADLTEVVSGIVGGVCTVWLSGGLEAARYRVVNSIVTSEGRADDRTLILAVKER